MDVVTFGETMVLFTSESPGLMRYAAHFSRKFGGAESNFAIGLARLGHKVGWISRVGDDEFGKAMVSFIAGEGVDVSRVKVDDTAPTGIYFKELRRANDVRVYYYRKHSAASKMKPEDLDEGYIARAKYLHITGITPALSESCYRTVIHGIELAKKHGVKVVFDPNLRKKLWAEETARETLLEISSRADIVLPGIDEAQFMFGQANPELLGERFLERGASLVVLKVGAKGAYYFTENGSQLVPGFPVEQVVDPVGAGDGFAAGFVSGLLDGLSLYEAVQRGNAVGAFATTVSGDVEGLPDRKELEAFLCCENGDVAR
ncbi:sugar kinase [Geobacillus subterraneus]|uniref:sugar kinase n=1 Tax=Geobacillus subterraneus TaxID=129338 RepID=UPI00067C4351|nr:sugar kinase [Geobacillus subterraneus]AKU25408.1 2-dehydro-3-deoxygluconokinase [Geobacillus sp. LC300]KZM58867.1 2-dehydro-3-deoxygluconokinase [Geobacillus stearothermophilus]WPZ16947.1 sugar kinase [Geobacillus subterraneus]